MKTKKKGKIKRKVLLKTGLN